MTTLAEFVRAPEKDKQFVEACHKAAKALVSTLVAETDTDVPADLYDFAVLATGANLFARRASMSELNTYQNGLPQPIPVRPTLDPLLTARHLLGNFKGPGIA